MKASWWLAPVLVLLVPAGVRAGPQDEEVFRLAMEPGWKIGFDRVSPLMQITEFIREGDSIENWKELVTVQKFPREFMAPTPAKALELQKQIRESRCPGTSRWGVISEGPDSIVFESQCSGCWGQPAQHEVARYLYGPRTVFRIGYTFKGYTMPAAARAAWLRRISEAEVRLGKLPEGTPLPRPDVTPRG
jgi:hypothetical protein